MVSFVQNSWAMVVSQFDNIAVVVAEAEILRQQHLISEKLCWGCVYELQSCYPGTCFPRLWLNVYVNTTVAAGTCLRWLRPPALGTYIDNPFLGHLLIWPNKPGKNVRLSVHMYVRPYVRTYVHTSTMKHNAATNQIVEIVRVDETFTTIWLQGHPRSGSRSRET